MMTFIYGLIDPRNNQLRYVGKSVNPKARFSKHIRESKLSTTLHRHAWIRGLMNIGLKPKLILLMQIPDTLWQDTERLLIASLKNSGYYLTNMADGGLGGATNRGKKMSENQKELMRIAHAGRWTDEAREEWREWAKDLWSNDNFRLKRDIALNNPEVKARMSKFQKARWSNPEIRQRQSEVSKKNWSNPELAKLMREKITQKWQDPEYRAKQTEARKRAWAIRKARTQNVES